MSHHRLRFVIRAHDPLFPLFRGDVRIPRIDLEIDHTASIGDTFQGEGLPIAEASFHRYVMLRARGDERYIGLPAFVACGFRHRTFYARRDSDLTDLSHLAGRRIGTNSWPDTGTFWARVAMREAGVDIPDVEWTIGALDERTRIKPPSFVDAAPPAGARILDDGATLVDALLAGELDAITSAVAPAGVFAGDGPIRRLVVDYPTAEAAYFERTGVYPALHIVVVRRDVAERVPELVEGLYNALRESWDRWWRHAELYMGPFAWTAREMESAVRDLGAYHPPFGSRNPGFTRMLDVLAAEQLAQGLVDKAADPESVFAPFREFVDH